MSISNLFENSQSKLFQDVFCDQLSANNIILHNDPVATTNLPTIINTIPKYISIDGKIDVSDILIDGSNNLLLNNHDINNINNINFIKLNALNYLSIRLETNTIMGSPVTIINGVQFIQYINTIGSLGSIVAGAFLCPETGIYFLTSTINIDVTMSNMNGLSNYRFLINSVTRTAGVAVPYHSTTPSPQFINICTTLFLQQNDTVQFELSTTLSAANGFISGGRLQIIRIY